MLRSHHVVDLMTNAGIVVVRPETVREEPIPAAYKTVTERVVVKPES
jgi:hypothetical protein